ncbi:hypothetical protein [Paracoccus mutanolyticus]|uniref:hypothetical protein n=1 Tax=Paracoccus mutanolyticus TaxID=1499308 RepID=UPI0011AE2D2F|nr:hypothetical protein [Paracoccus mutanolyticus]
MLLIGYGVGVALASVLTIIAINTRLGTDLLETLTATALASHRLARDMRGFQPEGFKPVDFGTGPRIDRARRCLISCMTARNKAFVDGFVSRAAQIKTGRQPSAGLSGYETRVSSVLTAVSSSARRKW